MNKIRTKEELKQELEQWKTILSRDICSYLETLIKLDDYILNNNATAPTIRENLLNLDIYRDISTYNI